MSELGSTTHPLRVAIIGAGPAGFYTAAELLKRVPAVEIDFFDRLPTPYGLVRAGVAPDHQKIKSVTRVFERIAADEAVRFFGSVELGRHLDVADLRRFYHQIVYSTGAQTDRPLGIPGEELAGSYTATEFVGWYNGHPDFRQRQFDLSGQSAAIIGVGNVALDVARVLARDPDELAQTDIADYALEALRRSQVREVVILGRRGPAQAAFTTAELKEFGELAGVDVTAVPEEIDLDPLSREAVAQFPDRNVSRNLEVLEGYARNAAGGHERRVTFRFLVSPVAVIGSGAGRAAGLKVVRNRLEPSPSGSLRAVATGEFETIPADLVFSSIGYRGVPLPGVPFNERWGVILNEKGRVLEPGSLTPITGEYAAGWIKRGPVGVIGTNKPDALETVVQMVADLEAGCTNEPERPERESVEDFVAARQPDYFSFADWLRLDEIERQRGEARGRPRVKLTDVDEMVRLVKNRPPISRGND